MNLNQTDQLIYEVIFSNYSGMTERKHVCAKDTVFGNMNGTHIVDTRLSFLPVEDVSHVYILITVSAATFKTILNL